MGARKFRPLGIPSTAILATFNNLPLVGVNQTCPCFAILRALVKPKMRGHTSLTVIECPKLFDSAVRFYC